jgi:ketosteroid isomerase-like protein
MSRENEDLVRSIYAAWERGDFRETAWAHPEIETVLADGPAPGRWTGVAGMAEGFREFASAWEVYGVKADEFCDLDDERVLVLFHRVGRGKRSGIDLAHLGSGGAVIWHVRQGKVTRQVYYLDRERALAELGLPSETHSDRR